MDFGFESIACKCLRQNDNYKKNMNLKFIKIKKN